MAKTFGNKVGTPRGYVDKEARDKVDEAMQPIAEIGKQLPYFIPGGGVALRGAKTLEKAAEVGAKLLPKLTRGAKTTEKAVETGVKALEYKPSVAAGAAKTAEKGAVMTTGRKKLMDTLNKSKAAGEKARATPKGGGRRGTFSDKLEGTRTRPRTPKEGEKFGALVKKGDNLPAKQGTRAVTPYKEGSKGVTKYKAPGGAVTTFASKVADKGSGSRLGSALKYGAVSAAVGGAGYGLYKGADKSKATEKKGGISGGDSRMTPDTRKGTSPLNKSESPNKKSDSVGGTKSGPFKSDFAKKSLQGRKTKNQAHSEKNTGLKNSLGSTAKPKHSKAKPMTAFERQKQRQYEKEGYGGRSMTSRSAESRVKKERGFKFKDLFKKK